MPPHPAPLRPSPVAWPSPSNLARSRFVAPATVAAVLAMLAGGAAAAPAPAPARASAAEGDAAQATAALTVAQDRAAHAAAAIDDLRRELAPGHLTDPMPDTDRAFGLASLRSDYADAERRAAGYRATLGDQHPTLLATVQLMDDLRGQLLDGTRKALASAERDAADARADIAAAEHRLAAGAAPRAASTAAAPFASRTADVTGSVAPAVGPAARAASPLSLPPAAPAVDRPAAIEAAAVQPPAPDRHLSRALAAAGAATVLAAALAAWAALRLFRPRRAGAAAAPARRVEPALGGMASDGPRRPAPPPPGLDRVSVDPPPPARPAAAVRPEPIPEPAPPRPAPAEGVPVLQRLTLPQLAGAPTDAAAEAAAGLHATLRAAFGDAAARMTVLVVPAAGLSPALADAAALALARAAAAAGRRPLLMEARAAGRLRGALVPAGVAPMLIEAGGGTRTLYRLGGGPAVALLPSDAGEAEAAASAASRAGTARLRGLDAFDTVILVGDDAGALAPSADLLVLAAPAGAAPASLAEAALPLRDTGRPCGAVLVAAEAGTVAGPAARTAPIPRRRPAEAAPAVRLGLRGSIEPARRTVRG